MYIDTGEQQLLLLLLILIYRHKHQNNNIIINNVNNKNDNDTRIQDSCVVNYPLIYKQDHPDPVNDFQSIY